MTTPNGPSRSPADVLRPLRRRAAVAWAACALSLGLLWGEHRLGVLHPWPLSFLALLLLTFAPGVGALARGLWRLLRGPRRGPALAWVLVALLPAGVWAALGWYGFRQWARRDVPHGLPGVLVKMAGASLMEGQARYLYPRRLETKRLVMFYDDRVAHPEHDAEEMDRHLADLEERAGLPLRAKVHWVRGRALGQGGLAFYGLALGSPESPVDWQAAGGMDRHEMAHAVLNQHYAPDTDPPTLLVEGWAESQSKDGEGLAQHALAQRQFLSAWGPVWGKASAFSREEMAHSSPWVADPDGLSRLLRSASVGGAETFYLRELTDPFWYHHDAGPVYPMGGAFVNFLLRRYGAARFVDLYLACRPGTFEAECRRVYGTDLDALEVDFWQDAERVVSAAQPPKDSGQ